MHTPPRSVEICLSRRNSDPGRGFRLENARAAFSKLRNIWKSSHLKLKTKLKIFNSNVIAVLLYGCETWRMTKRDATKLEVFRHKRLRRLMKIYWPMKISNGEIRKRANINIIKEQIFGRRWKFVGHVLRMTQLSIQRQHQRGPQRKEEVVEDRKRLCGEPQKRKNSIGFWIMEQGNSGCL